MRKIIKRWRRWRIKKIWMIILAKLAGSSDLPLPLKPDYDSGYSHINGHNNHFKNIVPSNRRLNYKRRQM